MKSSVVNLGGKLVGKGQPTLLIAEAGINHNGDVEVARRLIQEAKKSGADAVKFQTFNTEEYISRSNPYYELFKRCELKANDFKILQEEAEENQILFFSTPFDFTSVNLLAELEVPFYKIASCDLTNIPLIRKIAQAGKPIILSTGMGTIGEVFQALETINREGNEDVTLLHCVSNYPVTPEQVNLRAIPHMVEVFQRPIGLSDHTLGIDVPVTAVALGACIIEKHFTLDKNMEGPDHQLSADPQEFREMVERVRTIEKALGTGKKEPVELEENIILLRRSVVARKNISRGSKITADMVTLKRPGNGIKPELIDIVIGRTAKSNIAGDELVTWEDLE